MNIWAMIWEIDYLVANHSCSFVCALWLCGSKNGYKRKCNCSLQYALNSAMSSGDTGSSSSF